MYICNRNVKNGALKKAKISDFFNRGTYYMTMTILLSMNLYNSRYYVVCVKVKD
jgi:hypothetical protein